MSTALTENIDLYTHTEIDAFACNGERQYIAGANYTTRDVTGRAVGNIMFDVKTGEVVPIMVALNGNPAIVAQANDGRILVIIKEVLSEYGLRRYYALMQPEELFKPDASYTEVKPYEIPA